VPGPGSPRTSRTPRRAVTGRALVLGTLVVLLLVLLASPLHRYFGSRSDVQHASQQLRSDQSELAKMNAQLRRWSDPGYIQRQARVRLQYAMPGDTVYIVTGPGQPSDIRTSNQKAKAKAAAETWNKRLWETVQKAGS
jgi:cell division protein FtsB